LHTAIREWVDKNSFKGQGKKALESLPESLQYFYHDYKQRSSIFEAWGKFVWTFVWIGALVGVTFLFSLLEK
jgi:flagellar motor component MotA